MARFRYGGVLVAQSAPHKMPVLVERLVGPLTDELHHRDDLSYFCRLFSMVIRSAGMKMSACYITLIEQMTKCDSEQHYLPMSPVPITVSNASVLHLTVRGPQSGWGG